MSLSEQYKLAIESVAAGDVTPMMLFPIGTFTSAKYPKLPLSRELADEVIANFEADVLGTRPFVETSGKHDTAAPAGAWVRRLYTAPVTLDGWDGDALFADVEWNETGAAIVNDRAYAYNSVELGPVTDNLTGKRTDNVLRSITLTNTPVLRLLPPVLAAGDVMRGEPIEVALSEVVFADEDDPVAELLDDMDALAAKLDERLKGKRGMPSVRTYLREIRAKVGAHSLSEESEGLTEPAIVATAESVGDSHSGDRVAEPTSAHKEHDMSKLTELLKLSEDASPEAIDVAVLALAEKAATADAEKARAERAEAALAEREQKAAVEAVALKLDEAIKDGRIAPSERDGYLGLAEADAARATAMIEARQSKVIDLGEHGSGEGSPEQGSDADPSVELSTKIAARMDRDGIKDYGQAMSLVLSEDEALRERYVAYTTSGKVVG